MENEEFLGLRTVNYKVDDINKAKEWYYEILGKSPYFDEPFMWDLMFRDMNFVYSPSKESHQQEVMKWFIGE